VFITSSDIKEEAAAAMLFFIKITSIIVYFPEKSQKSEEISNIEEEL